MKHNPTTPDRHTAHAPALLLALAVLAGCSSQQPIDLDHAYHVYDSGNYTNAYTLARQAERQGPTSTRLDAAYLAGLCAYQLDNLPTAARYLTLAARSDDAELSGDAMASLGMVYAQMGRGDDAVKVLLQAARRLKAQDAANAYFYAAKTQQKNAQWPQARTNLILARTLSADPAFRRQVDNALHTQTYTLQTGAYANPSNAQTAVSHLAARTTDLHLGSPRVVRSVTANGKPLSLVHVGRFGNYSGALAARHRLGLANTIIVPVSNQ